MLYLPWQSNHGKRSEWGLQGALNLAGEPWRRFQPQFAPLSANLDCKTLHVKPFRGLFQLHLYKERRRWPWWCIRWEDCRIDHYTTDNVFVLINTVNGDYWLMLFLIANATAELRTSESWMPSLARGCILLIFNLPKLRTKISTHRKKNFRNVFDLWNSLCFPPLLLLLPPCRSQEWQQSPKVAKVF